VLVDNAIKLAREKASMADDEFREKLTAQMEEGNKVYTDTIYDLAHSQIKEERDRHSDSETIQRNVQICDLHRQDRKKWSKKKLAGKFDVDASYVRRILHEEAHWRKLASRLKPT